jgi:hypothetical protein
MNDELDILFDRDYNENDFRMALNYPIIEEKPIRAPGSISREEVKKIFNVQALRGAVCFLATNFSLPNG